MFMAQFDDCHKDEFPVLGGGIREIPKEIIWCIQLLLHFGSPTNQRELKVQKIVHLQTSYQMWSQIRHDIPAENVPSRLDVPKEQTDGNKINEPWVQLKRETSGF